MCSHVFHMLVAHLHSMQVFLFASEHTHHHIKQSLLRLSEDDSYLVEQNFLTHTQELPLVRHKSLTAQKFTIQLAFLIY